jgi:hypothetical protein
VLFLISADKLAILKEGHGEVPQSQHENVYVLPG